MKQTLTELKKETLTLTEASRTLGTSPQTLQKMVADGVVPCRRYKTRYFFSREALLEWLKGND